MAKRRLPRDAYTVACVCALPLELAAMKLMIDEPHDSLISQPGSDDNIYTLGSIGRHNVVFLCLPHGVYGTTSAATAVAGLRSTFARIRFGLMVGIAGGAPTSMVDVRLGDVVVSKPTGTFGGVIQYDLGKALSNGSFERTGSLSKPPPILLKAISELDSDPIATIKQLSKSIQNAPESAGAAQVSRFQRPQDDWLFLSSYKHESSHPDCSNCDRKQLVKRSERPSNEPMVHYGLIASGNQVIKDSETRDRISYDLGVICFEMEAAGIMDLCPSLVIRGICDYCDSHKNMQWQGYAALAAAAYAKQVLRAIPVAESHEHHRHEHQRQRTEFTEQELQCLRSLSRTDADDHKNSLKRRKGKRVSSTCSWFLDTEEMTDWLGQASQTTGRPEERNILWLHGNPGTGKSTMAITLVEELPQTRSFRHGDSVLAYFFCDTGTEDNRTAISILGSLLQQVIWQCPRFMKHLMQKYSRRGSQLFNSFDGLWAVLMDISYNSGDTKIFCIIDALDECFEESQRTVLRQIDQEFRSDHANHVNPESLHILVTSRPYPEISQYLSSFYNIDLASYPAVADDLRKVITEKVKELAMRKKYTPEVTARVQQILEEKAEGTFLWVGIACTELEDIPSRKAVATLLKLPRGLHSLYANLLHAAIEMNKDDEQLIIRMLAFLIIAREPPTVAGLSAACELFVNESEINRWQFTQEVIGLCRLMIVINGDLVRLLHKSVKDFLIKDSGKLDELEANSTLAYRCIDHFIASKVKPDIFFQGHFVARTGNDWLLNYSMRYWPEHAGLAQDRFTVRQNHRKFFCLGSETWEAWSSYFNSPFSETEYPAYKGFSFMHAAARWAIAPLIAFGLESSEESSPSEGTMFIDENFKAPGGETPLEEATRRGQTTAMALLLSKSPSDQSIGSNVLCAAVKNSNQGIELLDMLFKFRIRVTTHALSAAAGNQRLGKELTMLLLDKAETDSDHNVEIDGKVVSAASGNRVHGEEVMRALLSRRGYPHFCYTAMEEVCRFFDKDIIARFLDRQACQIEHYYRTYGLELVDRLLTATASNIYHGAEVTELLLNWWGDRVMLSEKVIEAAARNGGNGAEVLTMLLGRKDDRVQITEAVLEAASRNITNAKHMMEILLDKAGNQVSITHDVVQNILLNTLGRGSALQLLVDRQQHLPPLRPSTAATLITECTHEIAVAILLLQGPKALPSSLPATKICNDLSEEVTRILLYEHTDAHLMMAIGISAFGKVDKTGKVTFHNLGGYVPDPVSLVPPEAEMNSEEGHTKTTTPPHGRRFYLAIMEHQLAVLVSWTNAKIIELLIARAEDGSKLITSLVYIAESSLAGRESLRILLSRPHPAVVKAMNDVNGGEMIAFAAKIGWSEFMSLILLLKGNESINMQDSKQRTPLFYAAENGHYEVAEILLDAGSNPGHVDQYGWHAWVLASKCGHGAVRRLLFEAYNKSRQS